MLDDWLKITLNQFRAIIYDVRDNYSVIKFLIVEKKIFFIIIFLKDSFCPLVYSDERSARNSEMCLKKGERFFFLIISFTRYGTDN